MVDIRRRLVAEALGSALLTATVVGAGIMAERSSADGAIRLLADALPTGAILVAAITVFGPISGAHFNPAITLAFALRREIDLLEAALYAVMQTIGCVAGAMVANVMFALPAIEFSGTARSGAALWFSEVVATFGLAIVILGGLRARRDAVPWLVGLYIVAAYWFTASTSFANPAITIARALTNTYSGIRPSDAPAFIVAQIVGSVLATALASWLWREVDMKGQGATT